MLLMLGLLLSLEPGGLLLYFKHDREISTSNQVFLLINEEFFLTNDLSLSQQRNFIPKYENEKEIYRIIKKILQKISGR